MKKTFKISGSDWVWLLIVMVMISATIALTVVVGYLIARAMLPSCTIFVMAWNLFAMYALDALVLTVEIWSIKAKKTALK